MEERVAGRLRLRSPLESGITATAQWPRRAPGVRRTSRPALHSGAAEPDDNATATCYPPRAPLSEEAGTYATLPSE